jgi:hypothetical protein
MVCIKAWHSALLNEGHLEGLPDQNRVIFTVSDENLDVLRHGSLKGSSSMLCFHLPTLYLVLINRDWTALDKILPLESLISGLSASFFSRPETKHQRPFSCSQDFISLAQRQ